MQDLTTGEMVPLQDPEALREQFKQLDPYMTQLQALQKSCDQAIPDRSRHGPIFQVGEILVLRGGRFQVERIEKEGIFLKGLPTK